jgi:hypothetical protein
MYAHSTSTKNDLQGDYALLHCVWMAHEMIEECKFRRMVCSVLPYSNLVPEIRNPVKTPGESTTTPTIDTATPDDKRQSETQLEGDLKRQKTYDFENPKLPTSAVSQGPTGQGSTQEQSNRKHAQTTTSRPITPSTISSPDSSDLQQHRKRPLDNLVKGGPKRQKTPDIGLKTSTDPKILGPVATCSAKKKRNRLPDTADL